VRQIHIRKSVYALTGRNKLNCTWLAAANVKKIIPRADLILKFDPFACHENQSYLVKMKVAYLPRKAKLFL
jgi:hypothetical protein